MNNCLYCGVEYDDEYCSTFCEFMDKCTTMSMKLEKKLSKIKLICASCGVDYKVKLTGRIYYPCCSPLCVHRYYKKETKANLNKYMEFVSQQHGKVYSTQINQELKGRILKHYKNVSDCLGYKPHKPAKGFKQFVRHDIGMFTRSSWEANVIRAMRYYDVSFLYEPRYFNFPGETRGCKNYLPDLYIPETNEYWEVKGWNNLKSKEKMRKFSKHYPDERLYLLDSYKYSKMYNIGYILDDWEFESVDDIIRSKILRREIK